MLSTCLFGSNISFLVPTYLLIMSSSTHSLHDFLASTCVYMPSSSRHPLTVTLNSQSIYHLLQLTHVIDQCCRQHVYNIETPLNITRPCHYMAHSVCSLSRPIIIINAVLFNIISTSRIDNRKRNLMPILRIHEYCC